jgi:TIR domain
MQRRVRVTVRRTIQVRQTVQVRRTVQLRSQQTTARQQAINTTARTLPASPPRMAATLSNEGYGPIAGDDREFDLFLCHASENKDFVRPLALALDELGVRVWYDETAITIGDSLRESIDRGLIRSRFGAVIFSKEFFAKRWPAYELNGLVSREMQGRKVVLPVWHPDLSHDELVAYSPSMADKRALVGSHYSIRELADELAALVLGS